MGYPFGICNSTDHAKSVSHLFLLRKISFFSPRYFNKHADKIIMGFFTINLKEQSNLKLASLQFVEIKKKATEPQHWRLANKKPPMLLIKIAGDTSKKGNKYNDLKN
jgi:hypothetical protein